jgi:hypothetical protein
MGLFRPGKKPRKFDYEPRFYDPSDDEDLKRRMRVKSRTSQRRSPTSLLYLAGLLLLTLYIYSVL